MNRNYLWLSALVVAALMIGAIALNGGKRYAPVSDSGNYPQVIQEAGTTDQRVRVDKPFVPPTTDPSTVLGNAVAIKPLDRQSIYERAIENPTGMLPSDESIELFQDRISDNPLDYASWMVLGRLYLRRADENDDFRDLVLAETALDTSLDIHPTHIGALTFKAIAQNQQHKFSAAYETAAKALNLKPGNFTALAEMGDAQLELGNLDRAGQCYREVHEIAETPGSYARLARLAELQGDYATANQQMENALAKAQELSQEPAELGWYHWRLAELAWNQNQLNACAAQLQQSLEFSPEDTAASISQAKLFCAEGKTQQALASIQALVQRDPAPPTLAFLGDLHVLNNDPANGEKYFDLADQAMAEEATFAGQAHLRERAMFLLDHDREVESALDMVKEDFAIRSDSYAHDALAWAHFKNDQFAEASKEIGIALASGNRDPLLLFHGMKIYSAAQEWEQAKKCAAHFKESNPNFHPKWAKEAQTLIKDLSVRPQR